MVYLAGDDKNYITAEDVLGSKFAVRPEQVVDYKALVGDTSDNIPGVPGVGEKTASSLLAKFGTLDNLYAHLDEVENRWRGKLEQGRDSAYMSRDLAQIRTDLPIELDLEKARADDFEPSRVAAFFQSPGISHAAQDTGTDRRRLAIPPHPPASPPCNPPFFTSKGNRCPCS